MGNRVFTDEQVGAFGACHYGAYSAMRFDNLCLTIEDYHVWCKQKGIEPAPINQWNRNAVTGKNAVIEWKGLKLEVDSGIGLNNCKCSLNYSNKRLVGEEILSSGETIRVYSYDQEEVAMKALYNFYGLNRRTGAFLEKMVVGVIRQKEALNAVLLDNAAEITLNLGDPAECIFVLDGILDFEPIESED